MDRHRGRIAVECHVPELIEEFVAAEDGARIGGEEVEEVELTAGQQDGLTGQPNESGAGVDLQRIEAFPEPNILVLQGDITAPEMPQKISDLARGKVHCVLSDLAPRLSGIRDADAARCLELNRIALSLATALLQPEGFFLIKSFVNEELQTFTLELKKRFHSVQRTRPEATRQGSSEFYYFAKGFHGNPENH